MKIRPIEIAIPFFLVLALATGTTFAQSAGAQQEKKEDKESSALPKFSVKLFQIKHQIPTSLGAALSALGSATHGSSMVANDQLRTLTVRDFPENIAAIEEALNRLDVPGKSPVSLECRIHLLSASMTGSDKSEIPKDLEPVVVQLRSTLRFTNYRYVSSALNRVSDGGDLESSGLTGPLFPTPSGVINTPDNPTFYNYSIKGIKLAQDASGKEAVQISHFKFGASIPIKTAGGGFQYKDTGIVTPLTLHEGEIAAIGTVNISSSDDAIIVIVSIKKIR